MARADRYHHPFSLLVIRVPAMVDSSRRMKSAPSRWPMKSAVASDATRKSDYGCWIRRDT